MPALGIVSLILLFSSVTETIALEHLTSFNRIYTRMPQLQLTATPSRVLSNFSSLEACAEKCARETDFDCLSFDMDNKKRRCKFYNTTHETGDAFLQESAYTDHYRTAFQKLFNRLPNHVLTVKHKRKIPEVSVEQCARRCVFEQGFRCAGFDYEPTYSNCWLTDLTVAQSNGVKFHHGADFYERDLGGALSNFVSYGSGSLPYLDDRPIYSKTLYGLDLGACAQVCVSQTTFDCASFDYSFGDMTCHMSRYVASAIGGLDSETMPTYKIMHFEKKGMALERFYTTPYTIVLGENHKTLDHVTPERCAKACLEEAAFVCRSFDYQIKDGGCMLSSKTGSDVGGLYSQGRTQIHHFEMKPSLECGGFLTSIEGDLASPGWPRNYSHHLNCTWSLVVPAHKVIMFTFLHFDIGPTGRNPCATSHDRLRITEMTSLGEVNFCASPPMTTYITQSNKVKINFWSNGQQDAQGFKIAYRGDWPCHATLKTDRGEIASPLWPEQYSPGLNCVWVIKAPRNGKISLKFTTIDLDGQAFGPCTDQHDFIDVYDGPTTSSHRLARYCKHESASLIVSSSNSLLVTFRTDAFVQRTGFHASYDFILPPTTTTTTVSTPMAPPAYTEDPYGVRPGDDYYGGDGSLDDPLSAKFVEPRYRKSHPDVNMTAYDRVNNIGFHGGGYIQSEDQATNTNTNRRNKTSGATETYITILWTVLVSLFLMTIVLSVVLVSLCRISKNRREKKKALEKYQCSKEESLSLYERDAFKAQPPKPFDDEDLDSFREFPLDPDAFSNPLYESRQAMSMGSTRGRSQLTLTSEIVSDSGCSSSTHSSNNIALQGSTFLLTSPC